MVRSLIVVFVFLFTFALSITLSLTPIKASEPIDQIYFSGYIWSVGAYPYPYTENVHTRPTIKTPWPQEVFVDNQGKLHLTIFYKEGSWWSTEVANTESLGYGTYVFQLDTRVDTMEPSAVIATFIWTKPAEDGKRKEIDIEFSNWGTPHNELNSQFAIQPTTTQGNLFGFNTNLIFSHTTRHTILWTPTYVYFKSEEISTKLGFSRTINEWTYQGIDLPQKDNEKAVISYWVFIPGRIYNPSEFVVDSFTFTPLE